MRIKNNNNKTICTKNNIEVPPVAAKHVATVLGCSESSVKKVRTGNRTDATLLGQKVKLFDEMYEAGSSVLIQELVKHIKF